MKGNSSWLSCEMYLHSHKTKNIDNVFKENLTKVYWGNTQKK